MPRLTAFSRLLIVAAIVAGAFFAAKTFLPQLSEKFSKQPPATETTTPAGQPQDAGTANAPGAATASWTRQPFSYTPNAPVNGKLRGVVELGATGFNSFIIRVDAQKNWKLEKAEFGASLVYEKLATDEDVKNGLKQYIADMLAYGVGARDIHFVISSGAKKVDIIQKIMDTLKGMGYFVNTVTALQEAQYAYKAAMAKGYDNSGFVVDMGSGNTKIAWMQGSTIIGKETYGAKYYQNSITDQTVFNEVGGIAKGIPATKRDICFIIGGVPFELAKQIRQGKERYTVLKAPSDYDADGAKQQAGLNIYKAVADATGCKHFVFDWDANFTIGFLLNL